MSTGALPVFSVVPTHQPTKRLKSDEAEQRLQEGKLRQQWASVEHVAITVSFEVSPDKWIPLWKTPKGLPDYGNETLKPHGIIWILSCIFWTGKKKWSVFYIIKGKEREDKSLLKFWVATELNRGLGDSFESAGVRAAAQWWLQECGAAKRHLR